MNNRIEKTVGRTNFKYMLFIYEYAGVPYLFHKVNLKLRIVYGNNSIKHFNSHIIILQGYQCECEQ
jgi:hypothetical protein